MIKHTILCMVWALVFCCTGNTPALAQITLNKNADMSFGKVEYSTAHSGLVRLGTNGNISVSGTGLVYVSGGSAGNVSVTAGSSGIIEIRCDTTGLLTASGGGSSLTLANPEVSINSGVAFGAGQQCNGTGGADTPATTVDLSVTTNPTVFMGGEIIIPSNELSDPDYSSGNAGGSPITLSVVFQ